MTHPTDAAVEGVARVLCYEYDSLPEVATYLQRKSKPPEQYWDDKADVRNDARAAILATLDAIAEPSEAMGDAGGQAAFDQWSAECQVNANNIWRAMHAQLRRELTGGGK